MSRKRATSAINSSLRACKSSRLDSPSLVRASRTSSWVSGTSASRPSTRWSRFSMFRRNSKLAVRSLDFPLGFGTTGSHCSSRPRPCCDDSTLVVSDPAT
ncbi:hypothetical protein M9H77_14004 [Catharanthus roseus]|uniref:Uncharacterized protein n=1 Tax=Catharanthus roseus TaxID=4058 RepID=A0ACC0BLS6_CATRO|nr:hypothetical protein M9H77_14004 [Catharanthus roseus]